MNQDLLDELIAMKQRDMDTRSRLVREGRLYDGYADEMQKVHKENAHRLDELVSQHGWPTIALVGLEGSRAAWLIAQHSICTPDLQRKFLALLAKAAQKAEVPKPQLAFLTDRIRCNENKPQVYGTVLDWDENGELSCVVEDPANLDARRREMGLPARKTTTWRRTASKSNRREAGRLETLRKPNASGWSGRKVSAGSKKHDLPPDNEPLAFS